MLLEFQDLCDKDVEVELLLVAHIYRIGKHSVHEVCNAKFLTQFKTQFK